MIQRQQTLWLLLATLAALLCFMFPFVTGKGMEKGIEVDKVIKAGSGFLLLIFTGASMILSGAIMFLYKDRKLQIKFCLIGILLSVLIIILYFFEVSKLTRPVLELRLGDFLGFVLPFIIPIGYF